MENGAHMEVIPAIDLRGGRCVRLYQGDYEREMVYSESPVDVAAHWASLGAERLHVVDLDGARVGSPVNAKIVEDIASSVSLPVQLGGGIRTLEAASAAMALGLDRIVVGTAAVESPGVIQTICAELGSDALVVGVDSRDGYVAVKGWTESSRVSASELIGRMETMGVRRFMYTDIARDGTLTEPNFHPIETLTAIPGLRLLAAGGISSVAHLVRLAEIGVEGAVVGKALYTGDIDLVQALESLRAHTT